MLYFNFLLAMVDPTESIDFVWQLKLHIVYVPSVLIFFATKEILMCLQRCKRILCCLRHWVKEYINYLVISYTCCLRQHFMLVQKPLTMFYFFRLQKVLKAAGLFAGSIFLMRTQGDNMVI
jgi:hypothetical protein